MPRSSQRWTTKWQAAAIALVALLALPVMQCFAIDLFGALLNKNKWGSERPCLDCCVCPDDYCRKPPVHVITLCPNLCPDYCKKPEPCVPRVPTECCPDYCKKPMPCIWEFCCRPGLKCVADCPCCGCKTGQHHRLVQSEDEESPVATTAKKPATTTKR